MATQAAAAATKPSKPSKPPNTTAAQQPSSSRSTTSSSSSSSSHLAMVELKQRILTSLSKLSDRDTYQIGVDDLESIISVSMSPDSLPMFLNCLYDSLSNDPKPSVKKECLRLLSLISTLHHDAISPHLSKIVGNIVKRLKDTDSGVKDACRDAIGVLSRQYLKESGNVGSVVGLFVKPLLEAMGEQNKGVQSGAAMCMAKMVESAADPVPVLAFQKLCPRICKLLNSSNFLAKAALLPVVSSLAQVKAIAPQSLVTLLESIHECLGSSDWATRKAAAEALSALALHSSDVVADKADSTLTVLEACRFDKVKPVRDSMTEALQLWKKIAGKCGDGTPDEQKVLSSEKPESEKNSEKRSKLVDLLKKGSSESSSVTSDSPKGKAGSISEKAVVILKKKAPTLSDKEINPEFFQRLERRGSGDLPVEVVVPRRCKNSSSDCNNGEESELNDLDSKGRANCFEDNQSDVHVFSKTKLLNSESASNKLRTRDNGDESIVTNQRETSGNQTDVSNTGGQSEGLVTNTRGNWSAIQRQLLQLERQQANLMNMLQEFIGGSHDSMMTLENRVRGLERIVEDMARDLSISSGRRGTNLATGFEGPNRSLGKYNGFPNYSSSKYRVPDGVMRGRAWRSDMPDDWDLPSYGASRNGQVGPRRAWDKAAGSVRLGEGPSARSVWQASKDEATLEAIRGAGEDGNGICRAARVAVPEAEAMEDDDNGAQERDPIWSSWSNAMHALRVGDIDSAYAEVLSTGDDLLVVKLMERTGPVVDQLSNEIANEAVNAVGQFLLDHNLYDICLSWIQQLLEVVLQDGPDTFGIPIEIKHEILLNLHDASSTMDPPDDWEGPAPDQILMQLASAWEIDLQQLDK